jgi:hypothetical protein
VYSICQCKYQFYGIEVFHTWVSLHHEMGSPLVMCLKMLGYGAASLDYELVGEINELHPALLLASAVITAADPLAFVPRLCTHVHLLL